MTRFFKNAALLILIIVLFPLWPCLAEDDVFMRVDRDDPDAWKQELANRIQGSSGVLEYGNYDRSFEGSDTVYI